MNNLSQLITLLLGFATKLKRQYRRPVYTLNLLLAGAAIWVVANPTVLDFLHLSPRVEIGVFAGLSLIGHVLARGNSGDPLITAEQDMLDSLIRSEKNGTRGLDVVTDAAESAAPDAAAAIEKVFPGATPVVNALAELLPSAGAGSPAPAEPVAQAPVPPVA